MFRIVCDPSSGSTELCLTEITLSGSQIFFVCLVGVWQRNFEPAMCVCVCLCVHGTTVRAAPSPYRLNVHTGQDTVNLCLGNCSISTQRKAEPSSQRLPVDSSPGPLLHLGPIRKPDEPFDFRRSSRTFSPNHPVQYGNPILGF